MIVNVYICRAPVFVLRSFCHPIYATISETHSYGLVKSQSIFSFSWAVLML